MKINTTRFGEIELPDDKTISLPDGLLGFEHAHSYVLLEHDSEGTPFKWLQAADDPDVAFIVIDPGVVVEEYKIEFDDETAKQIGTREVSAKDFAVMSIVNIPHEEPIKMTVNLRAPILVHLEKRLGWQVILPTEEYPIRHRIFSDDEEDKGKEDKGKEDKGKEDKGKEDKAEEDKEKT